MIDNVKEFVKSGRDQIGSVTIYPSSIVVGDYSVIGANIFVDKSFPANSKIY